MSVPQTVAEVLSKHVVLEVESIDRMYLNVYVPQLQAVEGTLKFIRIHRGHKVASTHMVEPISRQFVGSIERFAKDSSSNGTKSGSPTERWRTGSYLVKILSNSNFSVIGYPRPRLTPYSANGCASSPSPLPRKTVRLDTVINSPFSNSNFPSLRFWINQSAAASSLKK